MTGLYIATNDINPSEYLCVIVIVCKGDSLL